VLAGCAAAALFAACGWFATTVPPEVPASPSLPSDYEHALTLLEQNNVIGAERVLRQVASSCENGDEGRRALLLLSSLWLDRHPRADPDSAALLAGRFLTLPEADVVELAMARAVYLLALELGADETLRPSRIDNPNALAVRFSNCDQGEPPVVVSLPELGRESLSATVRRLQAERDSLKQTATALGDGSRALEQRVQELQAELRNAQSEIERMRRLLGGRDTTTVRPPA
jgi:hypothetical protein